MRYKKYISILFLFVLVFSNVGWSVNVHYCEGLLKNTTLSPSEKHDSCELEPLMPCCENTAEESQKPEKNEDCCKDEIVKSTTEESSTKLLSIELEFLPAGKNQNSFTVNRDFSIELKDALSNFHLEPKTPPLFKLYCRYLLYA